MAVGDRSFSDVWQDILRNVQEIIRSEVRLAKAELREEAAKAKSLTLLAGAGAATAMFALLFLFLGAVYALALVMPGWAAALIVGGALAVVALVLLGSGVKQFRQLYGIGRPVETAKENLTWVKQQSK